MSERIEQEDSAVAEHEAAVDEHPDEWDEVREPYTRQRFLREAGIATAILAVGLPLVLLLAPDGDDTAGQGLLASPTRTAPATPSSTPSAVRALDSRPVHVVLADVEAAVASQAAQAAVEEARSFSTAATLAGKGWTSVQPSLGTLVTQGLPSADLAMVVVQAGAADRQRPADAVQAGAALVADRLRAAVSPSTSLTLVGPVPEGEPTPALLRVRDAVKAAAAAKSVHFVDPVELGLRVGQPDLAARLGKAAAVYINPAGA